jgi:hypothetical protein
MLTLQDCIEYCRTQDGLTEDEIQAVADHEHIPTALAAELADYLVQSPDGPPRLKRMILDDIADAEAHGDRQRVARLKRALRHFVRTHPEFRGSAG